MVFKVQADVSKTKYYQALTSCVRIPLWTEPVTCHTLFLCQDAVILELSEEKVQRGQVLGKTLGTGVLTSIRDTVLNNRINCSAYISTQCLTKLPISYSVESAFTKAVPNHMSPTAEMKQRDAGMPFRSLTPHTVTLIELHETTGSHGISLIKAIFKNDFTTFQLLRFNNYTSQWQSYFPTANDNMTTAAGKCRSRHKGAW